MEFPWIQHVEYKLDFIICNRHVFMQHWIKEFSATTCRWHCGLDFRLWSCREEENLVFWFGAQFISTLNFTQSGWLILFSPDLYFRLAKRVSGQNHSLRLETATRTDVPLVVPALRCFLARQATQCGQLTVALTLYETFL